MAGSENKTIKELIIVEGKNDAHLLRRALGDIDVIWTEGFGLTAEKIEYIKGMAKRKGVIICTDPDYPGLQIRKKVNRIVPEAKHVYIDRKSAYDEDKKDIGVENLSVQQIQKAFSHILKEQKNDCQQEFEKYVMHDLREYGLVGKSGSSIKRTEVARRLGLGDANAKQFLHRLNRFAIPREKLEQALEAEERKD